MDKINTKCKKYLQEHKDETNAKHMTHTQEKKSENASMKEHGQFEEARTVYIMTKAISLHLYLKFHVIQLNLKQLKVKK